MATRTKTRTVHFQRPFTLHGVQGEQAPGDYQIKEDEEQITGISWLAYRRISTLIECRSGGTTSLISIDHNELHSALEKDRLASTPGL